MHSPQVKHKRKIEWHQVTWYSKLLAAIVFVTLPVIAFYAGVRYEAALNRLEIKTSDKSSRVYHKQLQRLTNSLEQCNFYSNALQAELQGAFEPPQMTAFLSEETPVEEESEQPEPW